MVKKNVNTNSKGSWSGLRTHEELREGFREKLASYREGLVKYRVCKWAPYKGDWSEERSTKVVGHVVAYGEVG